MAKKKKATKVSKKKSPAKSSKAQKKVVAKPAKAAKAAKAVKAEKGKPAKGGKEARPSAPVPMPSAPELAKKDPHFLGPLPDKPLPRASKLPPVGDTVDVADDWIVLDGHNLHTGDLVALGHLEPLPHAHAVELAGESGRNGIYFIPRGTTVAAFLDMAGITADCGTGEARRFGALKSVTTVTLPPMCSGVSVGAMAADKRLALGIAIDINRATLEELVLVPGIGEKTAERIVEDRQLNGTFRKLEELTRVKGIKEKRLEKFRKYLCIGC